HSLNRSTPMKKLFTTAALIALAMTESAAQGFSVGLRTGSSCWAQRMYPNSAKMESMPGQKTTWDQELFVRWEGKSRWAFEGGLIHVKAANHEILYVPDLGTEGFQNNRKGHSYALSLSAQYELRCAKMNSCPLLRRFRSYAGVSLMPTITRLEPGLDPWPANVTTFQAWLGLNHTLVFQATPHLAFSAVASGNAAPTALLASHFENNDYRP